MKQNAIVLGYQQVRNVNVGLAWLQTRAFRCMTFLPIVFYRACHEQNSPDFQINKPGNHIRVILNSASNNCGYRSTVNYF
jgi:hypothetical protein